MKKSIILILVIILVGILLLVKNNDKKMDNNVIINPRVDSGVMILKVEEVSQKGKIDSSINSTVGTILNNKVVLDKKKDSNIIYKVEVMNNSRGSATFSKILFDTDNSIIPSIVEDGLKIGEELKAGETNNIYVSYHYDKDNKNNTFDGVVDFQFVLNHSIIYTDIYSKDFPISITDGEDLNIVFSENIPKNITIYDLYGNTLKEGVDYSYNDSKLIVPHVHFSITIKGEY